MKTLKLKEYELYIVRINDNSQHFKKVSLHEVIDKVDETFFQTPNNTENYYIYVSDNTVIIQKGYNAFCTILNQFFKSSIPVNKTVVVFQKSNLLDLVNLLDLKKYTTK